VGRQVIARVVGGGQHLDLETFVQCPGPELRVGETAADLVIYLVGGLGTRSNRDTEDLTQLGVQPEPHRSAAVSAPMRAKDSERIPGCLLGQRALPDTERGQLYAVRVQDPVDVMVRGDQQGCRIAERDVLGQPLRRHMSVWRDDRQILDTFVQVPRSRTNARLCRQQPVRVKRECWRGGHNHHPDENQTVATIGCRLLSHELMASHDAQRSRVDHRVLRSRRDRGRQGAQPRLGA
jgi:hypothetical protein